jgi:hypothetical protein
MQEKTAMRNLYDPADAGEIIGRIGLIQPDSVRQWGAMSPAQALAHCAASMEWAVGDSIPSRMFWGGLMGRMIKPLVFKDDKPFKRNSPTAKELVVRGERDFSAEQMRLIALVERFAAAGPSRCTQHPHSFFGPLTPQQWAILTYKHLDHHLRQFGV